MRSMRSRVFGLEGFLVLFFGVFLTITLHPPTTARVRAALGRPAQPAGAEPVVRIVTADAVPGATCTAIGGPAGEFPAMALPVPVAGTGESLVTSANRAVKTLRNAAIGAGANAVLGLRISTETTPNGDRRVLAYGTLATCR